MFSLLAVVAMLALLVMPLLAGGEALAAPLPCSQTTPCEFLLTITSGSAPTGSFPSQTQAPAAPNPIPKPAPPRSRICQSDRTVLIRLPKHVRVKRASVTAGGRKMKVIPGKRFRAVIDLRGLPKKRYTITMRMVTPDGRVVRRHRRFWTCTPASRVHKAPMTRAAFSVVS